MSRLDHRQGCSDDKKTADIAVRRANEEYCLFESIDHLRPLKIFYIMCSQVIYLSGLEGDAATFRYWLIITILIV